MILLQAGVRLSPVPGSAQSPPSLFTPEMGYGTGACPAGFHLGRRTLHQHSTATPFHEGTGAMRTHPVGAWQHAMCQRHHSASALGIPYARAWSVSTRPKGCVGCACGGVQQCNWVGPGPPPAPPSPMGGGGGGSPDGIKRGAAGAGETFHAPKGRGRGKSEKCAKRRTKGTSKRKPRIEQKPLGVLLERLPSLLSPRPFDGSPPR